jgi:hypothetical protein
VTEGQCTVVIARDEREGKETRKEDRED